MRVIEQFKRDILRNRQKAAILGALLVAMTIMVVRAVFEMQPKSAEAMSIAAMAAPGSENGAVASTESEGSAEERIRQSQELWRQLREVRGAAAAVAFSFDASFYALDPNRRVSPVAAPEPVATTPLAPMDDGEAVKRAHVAAIRDQLRSLNVKSTTVPGSGKSWAVVNQSLVSVGDQVEGFEITAIRSREVEFKKEGVTIAVKMPDDLRGQ